MIITIKDFDNVRIDKDNHGNCTAQYSSIIEPGKLTKEENIGKTKWNSLGYYTTIPGALNRIIEFLSEDGVDEIDLEDLVSKRAEIRDLIYSSVNARI